MTNRTDKILVGRPKRTLADTNRHIENVAAVNANLSTDKILLGHKTTRPPDVGTSFGSKRSKDKIARIQIGRAWVAI